MPDDRRTGPGVPSRPLVRCALAAIVTVGLAGVGCGDSGGGSGGESSRASSYESSNLITDRGHHTGRAAEVNEVLIGMQNDFVKVDGASFCDRLTSAGVRNVERFGRRVGYGSDCVKAINTTARYTRKAGVRQKPSKLISVEFKGDRAIATIRNGGRPPQPMVFVEEGGEWKAPYPR